MALRNPFSVHSLLLLCIIICVSCEEDEKPRILPLLMPDVQPLQKETYLCTAFRMKNTELEHIVAFHPNASQETAHHILIYGCEVPGRWERDSPRLVWECGEMAGHRSDYDRAPTCRQGPQVIYAWAKDAPPLSLPEGVAFKVGKGTGINYLVLQVHYAHVHKFLEGGTDNSGIALSLLPSTTKKVTKTAGVYLLGTNGMIQAKHFENFEVACRIGEPIKLHPFAFRTHTHALGKVVSGYKIDKEGKWTLIGKHNPQEPQMFYPVENKELVIEYGDMVAARCTMYDFRDRDTYVGSTGNDEMCNFYMMYYVDGDAPMDEKFCFSSGPPAYHWNTDPQLPEVPQEVQQQASSLDL